jgi:hypothetical protein
VKPIDFNEATRVLQKPSNMTDDECVSLIVFSDGKECISCWKMSFFERLRALFSGKVWISVLSGQTQPPIWLTANKKELLD